MKVPWSGLVLGLLLAVPLPARAQDESLGRFELFTQCDAMRLWVGLTDENGDLDNLTIGRIEQAVRSRLRAARLFRETSSYVLSAQVLVVGRAFSIDLSFFKPLHDSVSDVWGFAITWHQNFAGTYGSGGADGAGFVISSISQVMDGFLDEYLRVNEAACGNLDRGFGTEDTYRSMRR